MSAFAEASPRHETDAFRERATLLHAALGSGSSLGTFLAASERRLIVSLDDGEVGSLALLRDGVATLSSDEIVMPSFNASRLRMHRCADARLAPDA